MSTTIDRVSTGTNQQVPLDGSQARPARWPRLLEGTELLGQAVGSGLREPPYLVRRSDGQVVQVSRLLYVIASRMDGRDLAAIAADAGAQLELRITPEQVAYVCEQKLARLGLTAHRDGRMPNLQPRNALLALRFRVGVVPERAVNVLARLLESLFYPPTVVGVGAGLVACDVWLVTSHGIAAGLGAVIRSPILFLGLFAVMILSLAFHELGHAAACRYGGARPGRIGVGIYLVWPVFFTDVTDSYRLPRAGRLRTDLGGVYFNVLFALLAAAAYLTTHYWPLVVVIISQQLLIIDQFVPWVRLDGYHIVSDLIGVSDLFSRIGPVIKSMLPGRRPEPRVSELKPWARAAVTIWVLTTVAALSGMAVVLVTHAAGFLRRAWLSLTVQLHSVSHGAQVGNLPDVLVGAVGAFMLLLPVAGITFTYLMTCRGAGVALAVRRSRVDLTLAAPVGEESPPPNSVRFLTKPASGGKPCTQRPRISEGDKACAG